MENARLSELNIRLFKEKQARDKKLGDEGEQECLPLFREKFDKHLSKTGKYNTMDFISPKTYIELKSRNCRYADFDNIMIGKNKVDYCANSIKRCILAWRFRDGVYYYEFNKEDLDNGGVYFGMGGRSDRGRDEIREVAYVRRELLKAL